MGKDLLEAREAMEHLAKRVYVLGKHTYRKSTECHPKMSTGDGVSGRTPARLHLHLQTLPFHLPR